MNGATNKYEAVQMAIHAFKRANVPVDMNQIQLPILKNIGYDFNEKITEEDMVPKHGQFYIVTFERRDHDDFTECEPKGWKVNGVHWT